MSVSLHNVTIELLHEHKTLTQPAVSLARLDFITSKLAFVSYSNESKDIDLFSHEIRVTDTRNLGNSVFKNILQVCIDSKADVSVFYLMLKHREGVMKLFSDRQMFIFLFVGDINV